jgi:hypothetical protein
MVPNANFVVSVSLFGVLFLESRAVDAGGAEHLHGGQAEAFDTKKAAGAGEGRVPGDLKVDAGEAIGETGVVLRGHMLFHYHQII